MNKREILKQCLKNWFSDKMELQPTEENLNILVDRIYYSKQLNLSDVGVTLPLKEFKQGVDNYVSEQENHPIERTPERMRTIEAVAYHCKRIAEELAK